MAATLFPGFVTALVLLSYNIENIDLFAVYRGTFGQFLRYSKHAYSFVAFADFHILIRGGFFSLCRRHAKGAGKCGDVFHTIFQIVKPLSYVSAILVVIGTGDLPLTGSCRQDMKRRVERC